MDNKLLLTYDEAADALGVAPLTLHRKFIGSDLPVVKIGRSARVHRDDLERLADRLRAESLAKQSA